MESGRVTPRYGEVWTYDEVTYWMMVAPGPEAAALGSWIVLYMGTVRKADGMDLLRRRLVGGRTALDSMNLNYGEWRKVA